MHKQCVPARPSLLLKRPRYEAKSVDTSNTHYSIHSCYSIIYRLYANETEDLINESKINFACVSKQCTLHGKYITLLL